MEVIKANEACKPTCSINKREGFNTGKLRGNDGQEMLKIRFHCCKFVMWSLHIGGYL